MEDISFNLCLESINSIFTDIKFRKFSKKNSVLLAPFIFLGLLDFFKDESQ